MDRKDHPSRATTAVLIMVITWVLASAMVMPVVLIASDEMAGFVLLAWMVGTFSAVGTVCAMARKDQRDG